MKTHGHLVELAKECGATVAEMRGVVEEVFFTPRELAVFAAKIEQLTKDGAFDEPKRPD
jgi:hypothetical protein